jgi:integrase
VPRRQPRPRVAAGVVRRADRDGELYLRFRAVVYQHQVEGRSRPGRRLVAASQQVYRRATNVHDWQAAVDEAAAERKRLEGELLADLRRGRPVHGPVTFGELADAYAKDAQDRGTRWDREGSRWRVLVAELGHETPMDQVTADWLLTWRQDLRARRKLAGRSVNAYITLLRAICRLGVRTGRLSADPTAYLRPYPEHRKEVEYLTPRQLEAVLAVAAKLQDRWEGAKRCQGGKLRVPIYDLVVVIYATAARTGNGLQLRWEHVDWKAEAIVWQPREVKNRRRVVAPFTPRLREVLESRWPGAGAEGWVFPSPVDSLRPLSHQSLYNAWPYVVAAANEILDEPSRIPAGFKLYNLRHTRASLLLVATGNLRAVADLLGDTMAMVEQRYAGRSVPGLRQALNQAAESPELAAIEAGRFQQPTAPKAPSGVHQQEEELN